MLFPFRFVGILLLTIALLAMMSGSTLAQTTTLDSTFTYQGQLTNASGPVNGNCNFQFSLFNAVTGGAQQGSTLSQTLVVTNGVFTAQLDFGDGAFGGTDRYLSIAVRCPAGTGTFTTLTPRQPGTPAPYALGLYGLRVENNATSPNLIGGFNGNSASLGVVGATIGGGGNTTADNIVTDSYGVIGGGLNNQAGNNLGVANDEQFATVGGGTDNTASSLWATVGGGDTNDASGNRATVSGGGTNSASAFAATVGGGNGNSASGDYATVGGGNDNTASALNATVGGGGYNRASAAFATIAGGGPSDLFNVFTTNNIVTDDYGAIGGGGGNQAGNATGTTEDARFATVAGGLDNTASAAGSTVGGGEDNEASSQYATVGGGTNNTNEGVGATVGGGFDNIASGSRATLGGGGGNQANGNFSTVGGGRLNIADAVLATVGGGNGNSASGDSSTVGGGDSNAASADYSTIAGGGPSDPSNPFTTNNFVTDDYGAIGGGGGNQAGNATGTTEDARFATVAGGLDNTANSGASTVGGGWGNNASGPGSTIPGGFNNIASGSNSFAAGANAQALHDGAFVWADNFGTPFASVGTNIFMARATGGVRFYTNATGSAGVMVGPGGGSWSSISDVNVKDNIEAVDPLFILQQVASMPISTWNYESQDPSIRHIGPMAQDFYAAFSVGEDERHITTIDADGVALAAIQGLYQVVQDKDARIAELEQANADLEARVSTIEAVLAGNGSALDVTSMSLFNPTMLLGGLLFAAGWLLKSRGGKV